MSASLDEVQQADDEKRFQSTNDIHFDFDFPSSDLLSAAAESSSALGIGSQSYPIDYDCARQLPVDHNQRYVPLYDINTTSSPAFVPAYTNMNYSLSLDVRSGYELHGLESHATSDWDISGINHECTSSSVVQAQPFGADIACLDYATSDSRMQTQSSYLFQEETPCIGLGAVEQDYLPPNTPRTVTFDHSFQREPSMGEWPNMKPSEWEHFPSAYNRPVPLSQYPPASHGRASPVEYRDFSYHDPQLCHPLLLHGSTVIDGRDAPQQACAEQSTLIQESTWGLQPTQQASIIASESDESPVETVKLSLQTDLPLPPPSHASTRPRKAPKKKTLKARHDPFQSSLSQFRADPNNSNLPRDGKKTRGRQEKTACLLCRSLKKKCEGSPCRILTQFFRTRGHPQTLLEPRCIETDLVDLNMFAVENALLESEDIMFTRGERLFLGRSGPYFRLSVQMPLDSLLRFFMATLGILKVKPTYYPLQCFNAMQNREVTFLHIVLPKTNASTYVLSNWIVDLYFVFRLLLELGQKVPVPRARTGSTTELGRLILLILGILKVFVQQTRNPRILPECETARRVRLQGTRTMELLEHLEMCLDVRMGAWSSVAGWKQVDVDKLSLQMLVLFARDPTWLKKYLEDVGMFVWNNKWRLSSSILLNLYRTSFFWFVKIKINKKNGEGPDKPSILAVAFDSEAPEV